MATHTRSANRTNTDLIVAQLIGCDEFTPSHDGWYYAADIASATEIDSHVVWQTLLYLDHAYGACRTLPRTRAAKLVEDGVLRYLNGSTDRVICYCGVCRCPGENER